MRAANIFTLLAASSCLVSCSKNDETAPVPVTTVAPAPPVPDAAAPAIPPAANPPPVVVPPKVTTPTPAGQVDAGKPTVDAGTADAAATGTASPSEKLAACAQKCQGVLASCVTPTFPADGGGLPQPKDPKACQAAFDACVAACKL